MLARSERHQGDCSKQLALRRRTQVASAIDATPGTPETSLSVSDAVTLITDSVTVTVLTHVRLSNLILVRSHVLNDVMLFVMPEISSCCVVALATSAAQTSYTTLKPYCGPKNGYPQVYVEREANVRIERL